MHKPDRQLFIMNYSSGKLVTVHKRLHHSDHALEPEICFSLDLREAPPTYISQ